MLMTCAMCYVLSASLAIEIASHRCFVQGMDVSVPFQLGVSGLIQALVQLCHSVDCRFYPAINLLLMERQTRQLLLRSLVLASSSGQMELPHSAIGGDRMPSIQLHVQLRPDLEKMKDNRVASPDDKCFVSQSNILFRAGRLSSRIISFELLRFGASAGLRSTVRVQRLHRKLAFLGAPHQRASHLGEQGIE
jgi:hypothetical protein